MSNLALKKTKRGRQDFSLVVIISNNDGNIINITNGILLNFIRDYHKYARGKSLIFPLVFDTYVN